MNKNLLSMKGFPSNLINVTWQDMPLANAGNFVRTIELLTNEDITLFIYKDIGISIDKLVDMGKPITSFRAVDYAAFFAHTFSDGTYTVASDILYIYNIGTELSNNTEFSDKVLHKLVQHNKAAGNSTILTSDYYNSSTFTTKYSMTAQLLDAKVQGVR